MDPAYRSANEFNRDAVLGRLEAQLRARAETVKGVRFLRINLSDAFGEYDSKYKEFDFSLDSGNAVAWSAFGRQIQLVLTNGGLARTWKVDPADAEDLLRRTNGDRHVVLAMALEIIDAAPPVNGAPLAINTRITEYEIRSRRNLRLGSITVAK